MSFRPESFPRQAGPVVPVTGTSGGIAPAHLPRIFHPFDRTKPPGVGTGPGLSVGFGIVREHGGSIQAQSLPRQRAPFTVGRPTRDARDRAMAD